jgi:hypothetical protein
VNASGLGATLASGSAREAWASGPPTGDAGTSAVTVDPASDRTGTEASAADFPGPVLVVVSVAVPGSGSSVVRKPQETPPRISAVQNPQIAVLTGSVDIFFSSGGDVSIRGAVIAGPSILSERRQAERGGAIIAYCK